MPATLRYASRSTFGMLGTIILTVAAATLPAAATTFSALYSFGDSLSDAGNVFVATGGLEPAPPYSSGRFSNGPVWVQDLSASLGLPPLTPSLLGGNDFAVGGAFTGTTPVHTLSPGDLAKQFAQFAASHPVAPSDALYALTIGANDLFSLLGSPDPMAIAAATISAAVGNIDSVVGGLATAGARDFIVMTVPDLGVVPAVTVLGASASALATDLTAGFNASLEASLAALASADALDIKFLDAFSLVDQAVADPSAFGFTDVTTPCWTGNFFGTGGTLCATTAAAQDTHLFWDMEHPTEAAHALLANEALRLIPEHSTTALLVGALIGLLILRRETRDTRQVRLQPGASRDLTLTFSVPASVEEPPATCVFTL